MKRSSRGGFQNVIEGSRMLLLNLMHRSFVQSLSISRVYPLLQQRGCYLLSTTSSSSRNRLFSGTTAAVGSVGPSTQDCYLERLEGDNTGIVLLTLNRPASRNALSVRMVSELSSSLDALRFDTSVRAVIVKSSTPGAFCSGADLKERGGMTPLQVSSFLHALKGAFNSLASLPAPVIAAIGGPALGGGLEMALCCDFRVVASNARLGLPEITLG